MNEYTKIILSKEEQLTIVNTDFFYHKKNISDKIYQLFGQVILSVNTLEIFNHFPFPTGTDFKTGKISRGENYLGLPYILLDFPRNFSGSNMFAIRTMFWWGNFLSCTLLLSGHSAEKFLYAVSRKYSLLAKENYYICINESPWLHHFKKDNYAKVKNLTKKEFGVLVKNHPFIKISAQLPLSKIENAEKFTVEKIRTFREILLP